ncbi:MAG: dockerin type I repeat-containing protein [Oscillospiraceae bacterium]
MNTKKFLKSALCGIMSAVILGSITVYADDVYNPDDFSGMGMGDEYDFRNTKGYYYYDELIDMTDTMFLGLTNDLNDKNNDYYNNTRDSSESLYNKVKIMCESGQINNYLTKDENGDSYFTVSTMISSDPKDLLADYSTINLQDSFGTSYGKIFGTRRHEFKFADTFTKVNSDLYVTYVQATIDIEEEVSKMDAENEALVYTKVFYAFEQMGITYDITGDTNADAEVNVRDAAFIAQKLATKKSSDLPKVADFNNDEKIDVRDAAAIARYLSKSFK